MEYNDEMLLSPEMYSEMAKAYADAIKKQGFIFVNLENNNYQSILQEVFSILSLLRDNLFALGGFLGTSALYNLNEKHILTLQKLFDCDFPYKKVKLFNDKTKLFLNAISLENILINKLVDLAFHCDKTKEIVNLIKERTSLSGSLFKINGIIATFSR